MIYDHVMLSGEAGYEEHVPGVRHRETLHPRHVPLPGARHLHRHRPHFPQVCPIMAPVLAFFWGFDLVATSYLIHTINPCLCDMDI